MSGRHSDRPLTHAPLRPVAAFPQGTALPPLLVRPVLVIRPVR
ncbi:hypothetical protein ACFYNO_12170 [Kitasatospora sp. NPDC006697]